MRYQLLLAAIIGSTIALPVTDSNFGNVVKRAESAGDTALGNYYEKTIEASSGRRGGNGEGYRPRIASPGLGKRAESIGDVALGSYYERNAASTVEQRAESHGTTGNYRPRLSSSTDGRRGETHENGEGYRPRIASPGIGKRDDATGDVALGNYFESQRLSDSNEKRAEENGDVALGDYYESKRLTDSTKKRSHNTELSADKIIGNYCVASTKHSAGADQALGNYC